MKPTDNHSSPVTLDFDRGDAAYYVPELSVHDLRRTEWDSLIFPCTVTAYLGTAAGRHLYSVEYGAGSGAVVPRSRLFHSYMNAYHFIETCSTL